MSAIYLRARPGAHSLVKFQKTKKYTMKLKIPYCNKLIMFVSVSQQYPSFMVLHSRVGSWPHPQTLDYAGKACHLPETNTLAYYKNP